MILIFAKTKCRPPKHPEDDTRYLGPVQVAK